MGSPANTASRLGSLRGKAAARETHAFVEKLKADLQEAQLMLEVDPPLSSRLVGLPSSREYISRASQLLQCCCLFDGTCLLCWWSRLSAHLE